MIVWLTIGAFRVSGNGRDVVASVQPGSVWYRPRGTTETEELMPLGSVEAQRDDAGDDDWIVAVIEKHAAGS